MPDVEVSNDEKPKLFISHKHTDKVIAGTLADFISEKTGYSVDIHLSSDPKYGGPRIGRNLNEELRRALWRTDALILIYTTEDQDWSYCMYECGLATDPSTPSSSIYVLQCGAISPAPFMDTVRINAREVEGLRRLVRELLRSPEFFPRRKQAVNPNIPEATCDKYAAELCDQLSKVLPPIKPNPDETWRTWPFLTLEASSKVIDEVAQVETVQKHASLTDAAYKTLLDACVVTAYDGAQTPRLFGKASFPATLSLRDLISPGSEVPSGEGWIRCCLNQVFKGSQRSFVSIGWTPLRDPHNEAQYLPALCEVRQSQTRGVMSFDIFFLDVLGPQAMPASHKMIPMEEVFSLDFVNPAIRERALTQLRQDMQQTKRLRLPILDTRRPRFIVHKSLVDEFLLSAMERLKEFGVETPSELKLGHLLDDPYYSEVAKSTFSTVGPDATISDVQKVMRDLPKCSDVFITEDGMKDGVVLGWVTNISLTR
jgi:hypothetical protein